MFLELRGNGVWYYKKTWVENGARKVLRKSLNTGNKKIAQLRALQIYFSIESDSTVITRPTPKVMDDGFVVDAKPQTKPDVLAKVQPDPQVQPKPKKQSITIETQKEPDIGILLSGVVDAYLKENAHLWRLKEAQAQRSICNRFITHTNITTVQQCTKAVAVDFKQSLVASGLSNVSINKAMGKLSNLFDYIFSHYEHPNIFVGLKVKRAKQETVRKSYTNQEVGQLRSFAEKQASHYKYMILLGLFTGARAGELAQLYTSDVVQIDGIWSILIRATKPDQQLKTANAERVIPVHSELIKAGFIDFVKGRGQDCRLFPEFKHSPANGCSKPFVQWFIHRRPVEGKTYHEIRHSTATRLQEGNISLQVAAAIMGHSTGNNMTFGTYGSGAVMPIELLHAAIEGVSYDVA